MKIALKYLAIALLIATAFTSATMSTDAQAKSAVKYYCYNDPYICHAGNGASYTCYRKVCVPIGPER